MGNTGYNESRVRYTVDMDDSLGRGFRRQVSCCWPKPSSIQLMMAAGLGARRDRASGADPRTVRSHTGCGSFFRKSWRCPFSGQRHAAKVLSGAAFLEQSKSAFRSAVLDSSGSTQCLSNLNTSRRAIPRRARGSSGRSGGSHESATFGVNASRAIPLLTFTDVKNPSIFILFFQEKEKRNKRKKTRKQKKEDQQNFFLKK